MRVQHCGKRVADRAENCLVRLNVVIELIRRAKKFVGMGDGHTSERQGAAAVCHRDGRGGHAVVSKPGMGDLERVRMRRDVLGNLLFGEVSTISTPERRHT
jgi:hypothetical protein